MSEDEEKIRALVTTWMDATRRRDIETVLSLMTDDVVFLLPGRVMHRSEFVESWRATPAGKAPQFDGHSEIEEIEVVGDRAFMRTRLTVAVTPPEGEPFMKAGHTLSVLRKENGRWLLARDANLLV
jgi:uncharacterized protein (TIGR02246 family)